jgi:hypothetical protein
VVKKVGENAQDLNPELRLRQELSKEFVVELAPATRPYGCSRFDALAPATKWREWVII